MPTTDMNNDGGARFFCVITQWQVFLPNGADSEWTRVYKMDETTRNMALNKCMW